MKRLPTMARFVGCNVMFLEGGTRDHFMRWLAQEFPHLGRRVSRIVCGQVRTHATARK